MIEMTLEEDLPEEFRGGTLRINSENKATEISKATTPNLSTTTADKSDKDTSAEFTSNNNNCHWRNAFIAPLSSIPNKITESIWSTKSKDITPTVNEKRLEPSIHLNEDPNNFFTFRDGAVDKAVKECMSQFLDVETEGPVYASFLLTQINHWDTDKERLVLVTAKSLVLVKYDFIALKRLDYKKISLNSIEGVIIGNLVYPSGSLIPKINGIADGLTHFIEHCFAKRWCENENQQLETLIPIRDRNMKGIRLLFNQGKQENLASKWNPFNEDVPFWTFTFHPLYFHKDCTDEKLRNLYNLELFIEQLCAAINKTKENSIILQHNILLENYIGLGSIIHNRNSLGFFKVRGKFSF